jgi:hypothetical protein
VAMAIVFFVLGPRGDLSSFATLVSALLKVAITIVVLISASIYLTRLAWPGGERRTPAVFVAAPFIAVIVLAALSVTFSPDIIGVARSATSGLSASSRSRSSPFCRSL